MHYTDTPSARKAVVGPYLRRPRDASAFKRAITTAYSFGLISEDDAVRFIRVFGLEAA